MRPWVSVVRHALHPMDAAFELEPREHAAPGDLGDDLLEPSSRPLARRQDFDLPALPLRIFDVHAEEIAGEQRSLVPARAGPDLEDRAALVGSVLGQERDANRLGHRFGFDLGGLKLRARHRAHVGVQIRLPEQRLEVRALLFLGLKGLDRRDDRLELAEFARQRGILRPGRPLGEAGRDFLMAAQDEIQIVGGGHCVSSRSGSGGRANARLARGAPQGVPPAAQAACARKLPRALWPASPQPRVAPR